MGVLSTLLPADLSRPVRRSIPDQVIDRILDVVVRIYILSVSFCNFALDQLDRLRRVWVRSQVVTKHQRISLIGIPVDPHVHVCATLSLWLAKDKLRPQAGIVVLAKRHVVMGIGFAVLVAGRDKPLPDFDVSSCTVI